MKLIFFNKIHLKIKLPSNNIDVLVLTFSSLHLLSSSSLLSLQIPINVVVLKMVMAQGTTFFLAKNYQKVTMPKFSGENLFFLKINSPKCAPF
jgi:hypothetical protein